jgi:hypothetical protein
MSTWQGSLQAGVRISGSGALTMAAVMIVGTFAAITVSPLLFVTTLIVAWMIARAARRGATSNATSLEFPELPFSLRETVDRTIDQLPDGDARRLLFNALVQARPLLAPHAAALDEQQETATRENVRSLVEACCTTALELGRFDLAAAARDSVAASDSASHVASARELLTGRLSNAAAALSSLYVAGVEHGSPASDRVAELVDEINADANARRAAATEMGALLHEGDPAKDDRPGT